ncbi:hypothetical protein SDC9_185666 [bioreactor metagenome]|uniref:Uncharacterized protein n=1 Tax=bioreactor metagenome TaxID=1076179 RepID=A0A645HIB4_9ZZZZ
MPPQKFPDDHNQHRRNFNQQRRIGRTGVLLPEKKHPAHQEEQKKCRQQHLMPLYPARQPQKAFSQPAAQRHRRQSADRKPAEDQRQGIDHRRLTQQIAAGNKGRAPQKARRHSQQHSGSVRPRGMS